MSRPSPTLAPFLIGIGLLTVLALHWSEKRRAQAVVDTLIQTGQSPPAPPAVSGGTLQAQEQWE